MTPGRKYHIDDAEEARIQEHIARDPDAPEATDAQLAQAVPFAAAFPDLARGIGHPASPPGTEPVTLHLDPKTIARFRALGAGWRERMREILEKARL